MGKLRPKYNIMLMPIIIIIVQRFDLSQHTAKIAQCILPGLKYPILRHTACASSLVQSESVIVPHIPK